MIRVEALTKTYGDLTAIENVVLPMMLTNQNGDVRQGRAKEILELVGLSARMGHRPAEMSGGEQQRVAIAVALANRPPLLLADEPTGELDDATAGEILDLFSAINREFQTTILIVSHDPDIAHKIRSFLKEVQRSSRLTVLYTSHNMREMEEMSDRIIFLRRGKIVAQGTAQEITERFGKADLEEVFLRIAREQEE